MAGSSAEDIKKHIVVYYKVFAALAVLTAVTVAISYLDFTIGLAVLVAMLVASVKGTAISTSSARMARLLCLQRT